MEMKPYRRNLRIFLVTAAFGVAFVRFAAWLPEYVARVEVDLPPASSEVLIVDTQFPPTGFEEIAHGCGGRDSWGGEGSVTGYSFNLTKWVSHSGSSYKTAKDARRVLELRIAEAVEVLESSGDSGSSRLPVRVVLRHRDDTGDSFEIIMYEGTNSIEDIRSADLDVALHFETWRAEEVRRLAAETNSSR